MRNDEASTVAVLFARADSIYKGMAGVDVWDAERDALNWPGGCPVVAHPPCRAWGMLRKLAKPRPGEKELALWAVDQVRRWGGVLEHPKGSTLWKEKPLPGPRPGERDAWGGWTLPVSQKWWGHKAEKMSLFYIVGIGPGDIPPLPFVLGEATHVVDGGKGKGRDGRRLRPLITKAEREHTPPLLAGWLVELARRCGV